MGTLRSILVVCGVDEFCALLSLGQVQPDQYCGFPFVPIHLSWGDYLPVLFVIRFFY